VVGDDDIHKYAHDFIISSVCVVCIMCCIFLK